MGLSNNEVNLYIDMDGVICNFLVSALEAHDGHSPLGDLDPSHVETWDFFEEYGMNKDEFLAPILAWRGFWEYIPAYSTAVEFLHRVDAVIKESSLVVKVHFCSTPISDPDCFSGKFKWLKNHGFLDFSDSLILMQDKTALVRPDAILIDDRQETVDRWRDDGGMGILYPRQWNKAGLTLVEGNEDNDKEAMDIAVATLRAALEFRETELDVLGRMEEAESDETLEDLDKELNMADDENDFLSEIESEFPTEENNLMAHLDAEEDANNTYDAIIRAAADLDESEEEETQTFIVADEFDVKGFNAFLSSVFGNEELPDVDADGEVSEVVSEALAEVTPPEDEEVRSVSSTGAEKGTKLARFDLIPIGPLTELAKHFGRGALKYDDHNYRRGYEWSKSYAACMRHLTQFWSGEDCDEETGTPHVISAAWHCFAMCEFMTAHPDFDDRYKGKNNGE